MVAPSATKFLTVQTSNVELNRVQANVAEALRHLQNNIVAQIDNSDCCTGPAPGVIPKGLTYVMDFSGANGANSLRYMNIGPGDGATTACQTTEQNLMMPFAGTIQTLLVNIANPLGYPNGGLANVTRFTVRKNGVGGSAAFDTILEISLGPSNVGDRYFRDPSPHQSFTVVAGDYIGVTYNEVSMNGANPGYANARLMLVAA